MRLEVPTRARSHSVLTGYGKVSVAFDYNRKPQENFALGIIFSEELYFQITLAAVWRMDHKEARVKKGAS